jgi:hypothetical protein
MQVYDGLVTIGQLSIDGIVEMMVIGNGKPYRWLPVSTCLAGCRLWADRGLDVISRPIIDWIVEMRLLAIGNHMPSDAADIHRSYVAGELQWPIHRDTSVCGLFRGLG